MYKEINFYQMDSEHRLQENGRGTDNRSPLLISYLIFRIKSNVTQILIGTL
jgi:hypothetical protein